MQLVIEAQTVIWPSIICFLGLPERVTLAWRENFPTNSICHAQVAHLKASLRENQLNSESLRQYCQFWLSWFKNRRYCTITRSCQEQWLARLNTCFQFHWPDLMAQVIWYVWRWTESYLYHVCISKTGRACVWRNLIYTVLTLPDKIHCATHRNRDWIDVTRTGNCPGYVLCCKHKSDSCLLDF